MKKDESKLHSLLSRQLKRSTLDDESIIPSKRQQWREFITTINQTYLDTDQERYLLDRSIDISTQELSALNKSLQDEKKRLKTIIEGTPDAMIVVNQDGIIIMMNQQAVAVFGYTKEELIGQTLSVLIPQSHRQHHPSQCKSYFDHPTIRPMGVSKHFSAVRKNGVEFPVEVSLSPVETPDGTITLAGIRDITERKKAEDNMAHLNQELIAISRKAGMAEVATSVLHNIGNIFNSINVTISSILEAFPNSNVHKIVPLVTNIDEKIKIQSDYLSNDEVGKLIPEYLLELSKAIDRENTVIFDELVSASKHLDRIKEVISSQLSLSGVSGVKETTDIQKLVDQAIQLAFSTNDLKKILLTQNTEIGVTLHTEKQKLLQILINLITNAKDSITSSSKTEKEISVKVERSADNRFVRFIVYDNGIGIANNHLTTIFSMGFTTKPHGHGYGLHTSALIAKELGGSLQVKSEGIDKGATFILEIPSTVAPHQL